MLHEDTILGNGHIFLAGILNDVVVGLPLGSSAISYLVVSLVAAYIKNVTVNFNINTVDARGFNELLVNSRGVIVNLINSAMNEKGRMAVI